MRRLLAGLTPLALVLATALAAQAQSDDKNRTDANNSNASGANSNAGGSKSNASGSNSNADRGGQTRTIRGVIAGVTVEGETAIDYQTHQAAVAQATFLTVVGSPARGGRGESGDRSRDARAEGGNNSERQRHNVYVLWLSPRTKVRDASKGGDRSGSDTSWENLEVGDRVEATFSGRELTGTANNNNAGNNNAGNDAQRQKHGRHRTYFGDAMSITVLPTERQRGDRDRNSGREGGRDSERNRDRDSERNRDRDSDRDRDRESSNR